MVIRNTKITKKSKGWMKNFKNEWMNEWFLKKSLTTQISKFYKITLWLKKFQEYLVEILTTCFLFIWNLFIIN